MVVEEMAAGPELDALLDAKLNLLGRLPYSTEMEWAWRVVEAMTNNGWHFTMDYYPDDKQWVVSFFKNGMTFGETTLSDVARLFLSVPHLICLAALKVLP
jgi:hypothetical protein